MQFTTLLTLVFLLAHAVQSTLSYSHVWQTTHTSTNYSLAFTCESLAFISILVVEQHYIRHLIKCYRSTRRRVTSHSSPRLHVGAKLERLESALQSETIAAKYNYESHIIKQHALSRDSGICRHTKSLTGPSQFPGQMYLESTRAVSDRDKATRFNNYFFVISSGPTEFPSPDGVPSPTGSLNDIEFILSIV